jgi:RND superfamily putative drug exporter
VFAHDPIVRPIGFTLVIGVLVDAFTVRMALAPAAMALFGKAAWFPKRWERGVPEVDMEGRNLTTPWPSAQDTERADEEYTPSR